MSFDVFHAVLFGVLAVAIVVGALAVVLMPRITQSALFMAFTFLCVAGMFVLLGAETMAAFQVLIYVGAITVLILYGVMFTPQRTGHALFQTQTPWAAIFVAGLTLPAVVFAFSFRDAPLIREFGGDMIPLGTSLFGEYAFAFEIASVLLLAAMVGAIVLVKRDED